MIVLVSIDHLEFALLNHLDVERLTAEKTGMVGHANKKKKVRLPRQSKDVLKYVAIEAPSV